MAWIESHQALRNHPKVLKLAGELNVQVETVIGRLHMLWWWCLDYAPDGVINKFDEKVIEEVCKIPLKFLAGANFVDLEGGAKIHDWWDYAGRFLTIRYKNQPHKLSRIRRLYKNHTNNHTNNHTKNVTKTANQPTLTNLNQPTNQPTNPEAQKLAELLANQMVRNNPQAKIPRNLSSWYVEAEKLLLVDNRPFQQAAEVLVWCQTDQFWRSNILSMKKFREKYDQLFLRKNSNIVKPSKPKIGHFGEEIKHDPSPVGS